MAGARDARMWAQGGCHGLLRLRPRRRAEPVGLWHADVLDGPILGRNAAGVLAAVRTPKPGALYAHHLERLDWVDAMVAHHGLRRALSASDLEVAHKAGQPAIVGDVEGLDFLETKLER